MHSLYACVRVYCQGKEDASFFLLSATLPLPLPQPSRLKKSKKKCERSLSDPSLREGGTCNCLARTVVELALIRQTAMYTFSIIVIEVTCN